MSVRSKILGQSAPLATTLTDLYQIPAGKEASARVHIVNRGSSPIAIRLAIGSGGAGSIDDKDYIEYDLPLNPSQSYTSDVFELDALKYITVYTDIATASCNATGLEKTL